MNKLLSFRPEPFEAELEFEGLIGGFGGQGESLEQEKEYESRRSRGSGRGSFRSGAAPRPRLPRTWPKTGAKKPAKPPSWKHRPFPIIQPTFTATVPVWPPVPQPDVDAKRSPGGDQGPGDEPASPFDQPPASDEGSDFVRWAQTCLNGYLGLRLPVHGVLDLTTRNAIRTFQERQGLPLTGRIGPKTEAGLKGVCVEEAGAPAPSDEVEAELRGRGASRGQGGRSPASSGLSQKIIPIARNVRDKTVQIEPVLSMDDYVELARQILRQRKKRSLGIVLSMVLVSSGDAADLIDRQTEQRSGKTYLKNPPAHVVMPPEVLGIEWKPKKGKPIKIQYVWTLSNEKSTFPVGGILFLDSPGGINSFLLATFNTGSLDSGTCTNAHHAEMHSTGSFPDRRGFIDAQPNTWRKRVGTIDILLRRRA